MCGLLESRDQQVGSTEKRTSSTGKLGLGVGAGEMIQGGGALKLESGLKGG